MSTTFTAAPSDHRTSSVVILGDEGQAGTYVLRMRVHCDLKLAFGRFKKGKIVSVPAGHYLYVGVGLAEKGGSSLGVRIMRHATRTNGQELHSIRHDMISHFKQIGLNGRTEANRDKKKFRWHSATL